MLRSTITLFLLALLVPAYAWASEEKVGYVDLQRALLEVEEGKAAKAHLKEYFDEKQTFLDKEQEALKKKTEDYQRKKELLTVEEQRRQEEQLQRELMTLQKTFMDLEKELKSKEDEATRPIFEKMYSILRDIGESQGYKLILEKSTSGIIYAPSKYDLTNELIRRYDEKHKTKKKSKK